AHDVARAALPTGLADDSLLGLSLAILVLTLGASVAAWLVYRHSTALLLVTTLAATVAALRVVGPGLLAAFEPPTLAAFVDGAAGVLGLGLLVWLTLAVRLSASRATKGDYFARVVDVTVLVVFATSLAGQAVQAAGATWACRGFPSCNSY